MKIIYICTIIIIIRDKHNEIKNKKISLSYKRNGINGRVLSVLKARLLLLIFLYYFE